MNALPGIVSPLSKPSGGVQPSLSVDITGRPLSSSWANMSPTACKIEQPRRMPTLPIMKGSNNFEGRNLITININSKAFVRGSKGYILLVSEFSFSQLRCSCRKLLTCYCPCKCTSIFLYQ